MQVKKFLTKEQTLQKLRHYCKYQERCSNEVKGKLYDLHIPSKEHDELISVLIEEKHINDERFAIAYAIGKFRMNQWGRLKINYALQQKQINEDYIEEALKKISEKSYNETLEKLMKEKYATLKNEQYLVRKKKTVDYLIQKGYEYKLINPLLNSLAMAKNKTRGKR